MRGSVASNQRRQKSADKRWHYWRRCGNEKEEEDMEEMEEKEVEEEALKFLFPCCLIRQLEFFILMKKNYLKQFTCHIFAY